MKRSAAGYLAACCMLVFMQAARADYTVTLYANSAGSDGIQKFNVDVTTGTETQTAHYTQTQLGEFGNGRGVVVVGNTMYYTYASSGSVFAYDLGTNTNDGVVFSVAGASGLATAAWDGSELILGDYSGTNQAYFYTPTGTLTNTVHLNDCTAFCDGLEYANGDLVSNEADGGFGNPSSYDVYSLSGGAPITHSLISTSYGATGIAYDGTYYYVSDIFHNAIDVYDSSGAFQKAITLTNGDQTNAIEDLSVDYNLVLGSVPEPSSVLLLATVAVLLAFQLRKKLRMS